jgi:uncharacterized damage-inducible protein DinB
VIHQAIRTLYEYNAWANGRILDAAAHLSPAQFIAARGISFASIRDTLVHTMSGQWLYLERWRGRSPRETLDPELFLDLAAIRGRWDEIEYETQAFVAGLSDSRLGRVVEYTNTKGERWAYPLWQQMIHQVNHATQHRSEAAVMLTRFGQSPGWLDLLYFIDLLAPVRPEE